MELPDYIKAAIVCGEVPVLRDWQNIDVEELSPGEKVLRFAADYLVFPEGKMINKPLILDPFQQAFVIAAMDGNVRKAILSMARRGGKTLIMAIIMLYFLLSSEARENTLIRSAAMTREQAGLIWRFMSLICRLSPLLEEGIHYRSVPSAKMLVGLRMNVEYRSLSRDAKSGHGQGIFMLVVDECGQVEAETDDFLDMLFSSLGSYEDSKTFLISTQAPNDRAFFSLEIDSAARDQPKETVCHLYTAANDDLFDKENWNAANPSLRGGYRDIEDIRRRANDAHRIPAKQNGFLNLYLNMRVSLQAIWLAPTVWNACAQPPSLAVFAANPVKIGLDLSKKNDLTCAVAAAEDEDGVIHLICFSFAPLEGLAERAKRDKLPLEQWVKDDVLHAFPGAVVNYDMVAEFLRDWCDDNGVSISSIQFDRWRIEDFQAAAERVGFAQEAEWEGVGQGFVGFSPRMETLETKLLEQKIRHGGAPILNLGAASAVVTADPAGNQKLNKAKSTHKIDGIVAAVMAVHPFAGNEEAFEAAAMIG